LFIVVSALKGVESDCNNNNNNNNNTRISVGTVVVCCMWAGLFPLFYVDNENKL
jgi:hypothetical protein